MISRRGFFSLAILLPLFLPVSSFAKKSHSARQAATSQASTSQAATSAPVSSAPAVEPPPELTESYPPLPGHGLYAIWYKDAQKVFDLPFIKGGQMVLSWAGLEPKEGQYDFSGMDAELKVFHQQGRKATIQVNGSHKPAWLFDKVAVLPVKESQVSDKQGVLQYWDPIFEVAYKNFILAYGKHLSESPDKDAVLGIRLNYDAVGTEHGGPGAKYDDLSQWKPAPDGHLYKHPITKELWGDYKKMVVAAFVQAFSSNFTVFVRNNIFQEDALTPAQIEMMKQGKLGLFHTSSEVQARRGDEKKYLTFIRFSKAGQTPSYAESWADATGKHGSKVDNHKPFSPCQWNYWRLLCDMNCGVSFIAIYGDDLANAKDPEYRAAFDFASKYAGFHISPNTSPGAWVALREGEHLQGDYTFLMSRDTQKSGDHPLEKQGPANQHFGHWARGIEGAAKMYFKLNPLFAQSLKDKPATIRVVYLDEGGNSFTVTWDTNGTSSEKTIQKKGTGRWQEALIEVPQSAFTAGIQGNDIVLSGEGKNVFHMVEVQRHAADQQ